MRLLQTWKLPLTNGKRSPEMTEIQKKTKKILKREDLEQGYLGSILTAKDLEAKSTKHGSYGLSHIGCQRTFLARENFFFSYSQSSNLGGGLCQIVEN